jgi:hypothetical protein
MVIMKRHENPFTVDPDRDGISTQEKDNLVGEGIGYRIVTEG